MSDNRTPNRGGDNKNNGKMPKNTQNMMMFLVFLMAGFMLWNMVRTQYSSATMQEITYNEFLTMLEENRVSTVEDTGYTWEITLKEDEESAYSVTYYTGKMDDDDLLPLMVEKGVEIIPYVQDTWSGVLWNILSILLPIVLLWVVFGVLMRRMGGAGGMMGVGKSKAKVYIEKETGVT
ncbi:MAG: ATP-dependent metallopeptidase FtsH/Yme1/Tma family protein, partial [Lachnospiraceae bacterium]|nr:ATP-dependent metallopeptidase FtsH/Yme1/Tma family protein [Lachnospiraceae bacterium]